MLSGLGVFLLIPALAFASDFACSSQGGTCVDWRYYKCSAGVESGLCDGDSNRRCCLQCNSQCVSDEQSWASCCDSGCANIDGTCQDNSNYCGGSYSSGKCGGPSDRQCCSTSSGGTGGSCKLITYSSTYVKGYNGLTVEVEPGFESSMDTINTYARQCGVTVWVTHAYREEGQNLGGTVVPPATTSNHLVGHAIDFNVDTPNGWCNGDCMYAGSNSYSECFIQKVLDNSGLRWGGVWSTSDPVHIDDGMNVNDMNQWNSLYYDLQASC